MENLSFEQLLNENQFNKLKENFLIGDFQYKNKLSNNEDFIVDLKFNDIIIYQEKVISIETQIDCFGFPMSIEKTEVEEVQLNFYQDWLIPKVENMYEAYLKIFFDRIAEIEVFGDRVVETYCNKNIKLLNSYGDEIVLSKHLNKVTIRKITSVLDKLSKSLSYAYYKEKTSVPDKINMKLSKSEICVYFQLLLNSNYIVGVHPNDLFRFVEKKIKYYDPTKKEFLDIQDAKICADNLISKNSIKSPEATLKKLKNKLASPNFFESPYK